MIACLKVQVDFCCHFSNNFSSALLHPEKGQLVLAGDPKQLGPILRSPLAQQHGLGNSHCCMTKYLDV